MMQGCQRRASRECTRSCYLEVIDANPLIQGVFASLLLPDFNYIVLKDIRISDQGRASVGKAKPTYHVHLGSMFRILIQEATHPLPESITLLYQRLESR